MASQNATPSRRHLGGYLPSAFIEHGVAMLSSVLNSERAVQMNILIIRAFVKLRGILATHKDLARKVEDLENQQKAQYQKIAAVYSLVKKLIEVPPKSRNLIGFIPGRSKIFWLNSANDNWI